MIAACVVCIGVLIALLIVMYRKTSAILDRVDRMIDCAIENTLTEDEFSEQKLSKIEAKLYRFLSVGKMERQQAAQERDSIKGLISDISHQTKTPVANIMLYTQLLEEKALGEKERELLSHISSQTEKLDFLIQALVKISRLENGIITVDPKRESVEGLLAELDFGAARPRASLFSGKYARALRRI